MVSRMTLFFVLNNLPLALVFLFGLILIWGPPTLTEAIKQLQDVERRKMATQNPGYLNIDCGADADYLNKDSGIFYRTDKNFINTGENHDISPEYIDNNPNFRSQLLNLRSFPQGRKNCYTLKLEQGSSRNNSYFVRALFYYGNYDAKNDAPKFNIYIGVNYWTFLELPAGSFWKLADIVFTFSTTDRYMCLVNTGSGVPLISSLELRPLNDSIYLISSGALSYKFSYDAGSSTETISRYKDDVYDRIWFPYQFSDSVRISTSLDVDTQASDNLFKLPSEILKTAAQPRKGSTSLTYAYDSNSTSSFYVYFHFAEIVKIPQDQRREFTITLNGDEYGPFSLEYLKPLTIRPQRFPLRGNVTFSIDATPASDLPPILNAFEIYQVIPLPSSPTHPSDVDAIMAIKQTYNLERDDWQGDPCVPKDVSWDQVDCRVSDNTPRIISLNLSASKLEGEISSSFSSFQELESLDLSYNELTGPVPEFLAQLPNLKVLNLSGNKLAGSVPLSLKGMSDDGSLLLSLTENPDLCLMDPCNKKNNSHLVPIVASSVSVFVIILLVVPCIFLYTRRRRRLSQGTVVGSNKEGTLRSRNRPFTYSQIVHITANFSSIIGEGGFGKVYLGTLDDRTKVAVKLLSPSSKQGLKEFETEAELLMIVHHKMLVSLIGYCEDGNMALVYEYMANGNLREHLSGANKSNVLSWKERLQIAVDAAHGLEYLHEGCKPPIVHRDLKTTNILLAENMQAKIADFGLSKVFATENASHISTCPAGTPGYLDPEFHVSGNLNKKSDVYSFGIVLFELITGQPAVLRTLEQSIHILQWLSPLVEKGDIRSIVDPRLHGEFDVNAAWKIMEIAMSCTHRASVQRPDMSFVLTELKECMAIEMALGRAQRMQNKKKKWDNSVEMSLILDSDMVPIAR